MAGSRQTLRARIGCTLSSGVANKVEVEVVTVHISVVVKVVVVVVVGLTL